MAAVKRSLAPAGALLVLALTAAAASARTSTNRPLPRPPQLWATVDVCSPANQPHTIGIRGSMPGDGHAGDAMYMRFRIQYLDSSTLHWAYVTHGADSGWLRVGSANAVRQAGRSFQFASPAGKPAFTLRGVVAFQWRRGKRTLTAASRTTTAGHRSLAGADPPGYSAANCKLS